MFFSVGGRGLKFSHQSLFLQLCWRVETGLAHYAERDFRGVCFMSLYRVLATLRYTLQVRVVEEAIRYIDQLHMALFRRAPLLAGQSQGHYAFFAMISYSV